MTIYCDRATESDFLIYPFLTDDGPSPFSYLQEGEFPASWLDASGTTLDAKLPVFTCSWNVMDVFHNGCVLQVIDLCWTEIQVVVVFLFFLLNSKDGATFEKRRRGWLKRPLDACANSIFFS